MLTALSFPLSVCTCICLPPPLDCDSQTQGPCCVYLGHASCLAVVSHMNKVCVSRKWSSHPAPRWLKIGRGARNILHWLSDFLAGRMSFVLKNKRKGYGESFQAYSLGGCKKWPVGFPDKEGSVRKGFVHRDREGTCWKDNPFSCSLTVVSNILLKARQNWNGLVDSIVMSQHEMFMWQLV